MVKVINALLSTIAEGQVITPDDHTGMMNVQEFPASDKETNKDQTNLAKGEIAVASPPNSLFAITKWQE